MKHAALDLGSAGKGSPGKYRQQCSFSQAGLWFKWGSAWDCRDAGSVYTQAAGRSAWWTLVYKLAEWGTLTRKEQTCSRWHLQETTLHIPNGVSLKSFKKNLNL